jgi:hypothetical protein
MSRAATGDDESEEAGDRARQTQILSLVTFARRCGTWIDWRLRRDGRAFSSGTVATGGLDNPSGTTDDQS